MQPQHMQMQPFCNAGILMPAVSSSMMPPAPMHVNMTDAAVAAAGHGSLCGAVGPGMNMPLAPSGGFFPSMMGCSMPPFMPPFMPPWAVPPGMMPLMFGNMGMNMMMPPAGEMTAASRSIQLLTPQ